MNGNVFIFHITFLYFMYCRYQCLLETTKKVERGVSNGVCCKRKCPANAYEGGDRLCISNVGKGIRLE